MKRLPSLLLALLLTPVVLACTPVGNRPQTPSSPVSDPTSNPTLPVIDRFTLDELFAQDGGGCGMTLWHRDDGLRSPEYLFFNGLAQPSADAIALMKLDGEFIRFRRIAASGDEFYGQQTSQTFASPDNAMQLQVDVTLGEPGEIESVSVEGTLQLQQNGEMTEIPVLGDAGC
ncbi:MULTISPECIES: hypothetical protein [Cyanophyceae]|uniref:hypothetical protein n=1 Tax=Cyanophyceae TaxID=3028117 RepID=UPI001686A65C|nr:MULTISPECIES: hypothetical protein [Cyanophyceae]MBD1914414.1 hypothetical protein [Phormidium sp. FACHB-77]MBD2028857.1 hypothetical protein [Phormidium sp. FACHB-322]MBD2049239.1 hypothetical protein [Leptolyngbya sp. FACHB-60]